MTNEERKQRAAMTYGMFVMCHAAEKMIEYVSGKSLMPSDGLRTEAKKAYTMMVDGIKKALIGYRMLNERTAGLYYDIAGDKGNDKMDDIRRDSNEAIRDYIYRRNAIDSPEDAELFDKMCNNAQFWHPGTIISQEVINQFRMK